MAVISKKDRSQFVSVTLVTRLVLGLIVVANLVGGAALWSHRADGIGATAANDLRARLSTLQPLLAAGAWSDPATLHQFSTEMDPISNDLHALDSIIPFGGALPLGGGQAEHHALTMAEDLVVAAKDASAADLILLPTLNSLEASALVAVSGARLPGSHVLTPSDVTAVQQNLNPAKSAMQGAAAEWMRIAPGDQSRLERSAYGPFLQVMSKMGAQLNDWLQLESAVIDWSGGLLGLQGSAQLLLVMMDSNVPRPTGGAITHYALLTLNQGVVAPGIQLQPIAGFDCPLGTCPVHPLPSNYQWMPLAPAQYGLGFSNLDPNFTVSARSIFNAFTEEGGPKVSGIIAITPATLASVLDATGSVALPQFGITVTAGNLLPRMRQYDELGENGQQATGADFGAALFQAIGRRMASLNAQQQAQLWHGLGDDLATKDIQLYAFNSRTEGGLAALDLAADVPPIQHGDDLYVVDTNLDGAPVGALVSERISDTIAMDKTQGAQHSLSITYHYTALSGAQQSMPYNDLVRVIVANGAALEPISGPCTSIPTATTGEAYRTTLACRFQLQPGQSLTLHFAWSASDVVNRTGVPTYSLLVQRQAGAQVAISVRIAAPSGYTFSHPEASAGAAAHEDNGALTWSASPLTRDTLLSASLVPSGTGSGS